MDAERRCDRSLWACGACCRYRRNGPYDVLVDGANVAYYGQNRDGGGFSWAQIRAMMAMLKERYPGKKVLLVGPPPPKLPSCWPQMAPQHARCCCLAIARAGMAAAISSQVPCAERHSGKAWAGRVKAGQVPAAQPSKLAGRPSGPVNPTYA